MKSPANEDRTQFEKREAAAQEERARSRRTSWGVKEAPWQWDSYLFWTFKKRRGVDQRKKAQAPQQQKQEAVGWATREEGAQSCTGLWKAQSV